MDLKTKKIIVTGGNGFLGKRVVKFLLKRGVSSENIFVPEHKDYDLEKEEEIKKMFIDFPANIVIHLAATVGGIGYNLDNPGSLFYNNALMGIQLMEQARLHNIEKFVVLGTVCAYPKNALIPFKEEDFWNGYPAEVTAPYGFAKKMLLVQSQAYRKQYGFNSIFLIPVNLYGPGDNFDPQSSHVVAALIKKIIDAKNEDNDEEAVWGSGTASREFLYIDDCAKAIVLATERYDGNGPVNLGSGKETTIKELANQIKEIVEFKGNLVWDVSKPDGQPRRCLDVSMAEREFDFKAETSLEEGLNKTIRWYLENK
ncbi:GDP-L-fucose synthase [archaeon]|nr:GDP-L-fucose synthase [archaeon]MBT4241376.1 GDP-L-fucose synthase [archaeon]MBT4418197.1 GDP-L-fucose synthase [archaeon]